MCSCSRLRSQKETKLNPLGAAQSIRYNGEHAQPISSFDIPGKNEEALEQCRQCRVRRPCATIASLPHLACSSLGSEQCSALGSARRSALGSSPGSSHRPPGPRETAAAAKSPSQNLQQFRAVWVPRGLRYAVHPCVSWGSCSSDYRKHTKSQKMEHRRPSALKRFTNSWLPNAVTFHWNSKAQQGIQVAHLAWSSTTESREVELFPRLTGRGGWCR